MRRSARHQQHSRRNIMKKLWSKFIALRCQVQIQRVIRTHLIEVYRGNPRALWVAVDLQLESAERTNSAHTADNIAVYFWSEIDSIRSATEFAPSPVITPRPFANPLLQFKPVAEQEIWTILGICPTKPCLLDLVPTWLLNSFQRFSNHVSSLQSSSSVSTVSRLSESELLSFLVCSAAKADLAISK